MGMLRDQYDWWIVNRYGECNKEWPPRYTYDQRYTYNNRYYLDDELYGYNRDMEGDTEKIWKNIEQTRREREKEEQRLKREVELQQRKQKREEEKEEKRRNDDDIWQLNEEYWLLKADADPFKLYNPKAFCCCLNKRIFDTRESSFMRKCCFSKMFDYAKELNLKWDTEKHKSKTKKRKRTHRDSVCARRLASAIPIPDLDL